MGLVDGREMRKQYREYLDVRHRWERLHAIRKLTVSKHILFERRKLVATMVARGESDDVATRCSMETITGYTHSYAKIAPVMYKLLCETYREMLRYENVIAKYCLEILAFWQTHQSYKKYFGSVSDEMHLRAVRSITTNLHRCDISRGQPWSYFTMVIRSSFHQAIKEHNIKNALGKVAVPFSHFDSYAAEDVDSVDDRERDCDLTWAYAPLLSFDDVYGDILDEDVQCVML